MKNLLLIFLALSFLFTACRENDGPSDCETFKNTKGEIQLWQPAGKNETILVQAENNNVITGTVVFKLNKQYDEIRWLINNDSNYTYTTKEVSLSFPPLRTFTVSAIGIKYFDNKDCGKVSFVDTLNSSFRTFSRNGIVGLFSKKFEIESTQYPGEKWTFYFRNTNGPINDFHSANETSSGSTATSFKDRSNDNIWPPYLVAVDFPRYENDSFRVRYFDTDGYTYFEMPVTYWSPFVDPFDTSKYGLLSYLKLDLDVKTNKVTGEYNSIHIDSLSGRLISKLETFKGIAK
jgi:hypothetical protein